MQDQKLLANNIPFEHRLNNVIEYQIDVATEIGCNALLHMIKKGILYGIGYVSAIKDLTNKNNFSIQFYASIYHEKNGKKITENFKNIDLAKEFLRELILIEAQETRVRQLFDLVNDWNGDKSLHIGNIKKNHT